MMYELLAHVYDALVKDDEATACWAVSYTHLDVYKRQLGANLMGLHTVLTAPVVTRDLSFTKFNRFFENIVFRLLQITGRLRKGEYDE